jgi:predicted Rossmann fold nucleotide-binding protein DprA/Smf involved in DNA uptake
MDRDMSVQLPEAAFWLALTYASGIKLARIKDIISAWCLEEARSLSALFDMDAEALVVRFTLSAEEREGMSAAARRVPEQVSWLNQLQAENIQLITRADARYPAALIRWLPAALQPLLLFAQGEVSLLGRPSAAVIGAPEASDQATDFAHGLGGLLAEEGLVVISGLGKGVGQAAFDAALSEEAGQCLAVLPMGLQSFTNVSAIAGDLPVALQQGRALLLSPFHPQAKFSQTQAAARNKLLVALAQAVFVVTSGEEGITQDTAAEALRLGKAVYVWDVDAAAEPAASGNQALIQAGGLPITAMPDILDAVEITVAAALELSEAAPISPVATSQVDESEVETPYDPQAVVELLAESGRVPEALIKRLREG